MFGGSEVNINFPTSIPVHLTYQTAFVDDAGKLQIRDDVYGRDAIHLDFAGHFSPYSPGTTSKSGAGGQ
jgi:murein L,D-transpeptidase YcbB/YkuD